jgi:hypothetical protein
MTNETYEISIPANAVTDVYGVQLALVSFSSLRPRCPLTITGTYPKGNTTNVPVTSDVMVFFYRNVKPGGNFSAIVLKDATGAPATITRSVSNSRLTIHPVNRLASNTTYTVFVPAGAARLNYVFGDYIEKC